MIYPSPDSLPTSHTAWICIKNTNNNNNIGDDIINKLNNTETNNKLVGDIYAKYYITAQKIMIGHLPDSVTKNNIIKIINIQIQAKDVSEHSG